MKNTEVKRKKTSLVRRGRRALLDVFPLPIRTSCASMSPTASPRRWFDDRVPVSLSLGLLRCSKRLRTRIVESFPVGLSTTTRFWRFSALTRLVRQFPWTLRSSSHSSDAMGACPSAKKWRALSSVGDIAARFVFGIALEEHHHNPNNPKFVEFCWKEHEQWLGCLLFQT